MSAISFTTASRKRPTSATKPMACRPKAPIIWAAATRSASARSIRPTIWSATTSSLVLPTRSGRAWQSQSQSALHRSGEHLPDLGCSPQHHRQRHQTRLELQILPSGRMEGHPDALRSITACATTNIRPIAAATRSVRASMRCGRRATAPSSMRAMRAISRRRRSNWSPVPTSPCSTTRQMRRQFRRTPLR